MRSRSAATSVAAGPCRGGGESGPPGRGCTASAEFNAGYREIRRGRGGALCRRPCRRRPGVVRERKGGGCRDLHLAMAGAIEAREVVYWGRTAWFLEECWKDYEVFLDDPGKPAAKGTLRRLHGPQRYRLGRRKTRLAKIMLKFHNSYGGPNPGAAEIQVFADSPSERQLAESVKVPRSDFDLPPMPWVGKVDPAALRALILELAGRYGGGYRQAAEHWRAWSGWKSRGSCPRPSRARRTSPQRSPRSWTSFSARCCCSTSTPGGRQAGTRSRPLTSTPTITKVFGPAGDCTSSSSGRPKPAPRAGRLGPRPDPRLRSVLRRPEVAVQLAAAGGRRLSPVDVDVDGAGPDGSSPTARGTTTTPAGCPTAASPS